MQKWKKKDFQCETKYKKLKLETIKWKRKKLNAIKFSQNTLTYLISYIRVHGCVYLLQLMTNKIYMA